MDKYWQRYVKKMSQTLGTFVLNVGDECTEYSGQLSPMFGTFFVVMIFEDYPKRRTLFYAYLWVYLWPFSSLYKESPFLICRDVAIATSGSGVIASR